MVMKIFGCLNVLFGIGGVYYFVLRVSWRNWPGSPSTLNWLVFVLISAVTLALMGYLSYLGIRLFRGDRSALSPTALVLLLELFYFAISVVLFWIVLSNRQITVGFFGIASSALDPQVVTGYPLWGLVSMVLLQRGFKKHATKSDGL